jgi:diacylglycerol kinase family enzyme
MAERDVCVIFNPASGKRRGRRRLDQLRATWAGHADFQPTCAPGDAERLATEAARAGYGIVAAAGGDGTVHEVVNGLMRAGRPEVQFALVPIGSANDYAYSLERVAPGTTRVDVGRVRAANGRERYFACNLGLGLGSAVTWESRSIRSLQGIALYGLGTLRALAKHFQHVTMEIRIDDEPPWRTPTLLFSVLNGKREGGFVLAPHAELDDGCLDYLHAGALSRWQALRLLPRLALWGAPASYPGLRQGRCRHIQLHSEQPLRVHTDGEFFCLPDDGVHDLDIDVLPGALAVYVDHCPAGGVAGRRFGVGGWR